jgi:glutamine amidotransferase
MGNLRSVHKALEKVGFTARVTSSPQQIRDASAIVLPGVGAFKDCVLNLEKLNLIEPILQSVRNGKPFLGICLGLQVLFTESDEFGKTPGLDLIKGRVVHFSQDDSSWDNRLKIHHMGWNALSFKKTIPIFKSIKEDPFSTLYTHTMWSQMRKQ